MRTEPVTSSGSVRVPIDIDLDHRPDTGDGGSSGGSGIPRTNRESIETLDELIEESQEFPEESQEKNFVTTFPRFHFLIETDFFAQAPSSEVAGVVYGPCRAWQRFLSSAHPARLSLAIASASISTSTAASHPADECHDPRFCAVERSWPRRVRQSWRTRSATRSLVSLYSFDVSGKPASS